MAECARLESEYTARYHRFKSCTLRFGREKAVESSPAQAGLLSVAKSKIWTEREESRPFRHACEASLDRLGVRVLLCFAEIRPWGSDDVLYFKERSVLWEGDTLF